MAMFQGELRYRPGCLDKTRFTCRGNEAVLNASRGNGGLARLIRERAAGFVALDVEPHEDGPRNRGSRSNAVGEALERLPPFRPFLSYQFAVE